MSKINFTKIEKVLDDALHEMHIDDLFETATLADLTKDPHKVPYEVMEAIIDKFRKEMNRIEKEDPILSKALNLSDEEIKRFAKEAKDYTLEDWKGLISLREKIEILKKTPYGRSEPDETQTAQIEKERKEHINKRFNVKKGWLPLK